AMAVTASTLTTVAVFFPMVFVSGIAGQLFRDQALTVTFAQVLSLLVSLTLVPMMAAWRVEPAGRYVPQDALRPELAARARLFAERGRAIGRALRPGEFAQAPASRGARRILAWFAWPWRLLLVTVIRLLRALGGAAAALCGLLLAPAVHVTQRGFAWLDRLYPATLAWALRRRALVLGIAVSLLGATGYALSRLPTELIPQLAQGEFSVKLRLPAGSPLDSTDRMLRAAQAAALELPGLDQAYAVSGTGNRLDANPVDSGENIGELAIRLKQPAGPREEAAAMERLRRALDALPGVQYEFNRPALFTLSTPLEVVLSGFELERLQAAASTVRARMEASGAFTDLRSSIEGGHPEIQIHFDQDRASKLGLEVRALADRVVASLRGDVATRYQLRDRKIDVLVRSVDTRSASIEDVRNLIVNPGAERAVPLAAVADVRLAMGPAEIRRASQERVAVLSAAPAGDNLGAATEVARGILAGAALPAGITSEVTGQSEEMQQSFRSLLMAFALAVFLVYLVMASQFESLRHPFVILFTIPMGLIGAVWGLVLTGTTVNAVAFIGLILLAGIVVNNAIVLLDAVNQARERGLPRHDALLLAGRTRLRPILITSVSTILGLVPMAIGLGEGAEVRRPMAITVIGGMLVATVLTLVIIPVLYTLLDRRERPATANALVAPRA
ncbi:MAG: efflux RND transporter permease subunit, partial [Steroidobacteraceae bacterium]